MLTIAFLSVACLTALVWFILAVGLVRRHPPAGIALAGLVIILLWESPVSPSLITVAGLTVTAADVITLILFVVGLLEMDQLRANLRGWFVPWCFLGFWISLSLLRGAASFGLATATNEARGVLWVYFAMTWGLACRPDRLRLHVVSLILGWILVLVAIYHGVKYGIGGPTAISIDGDGFDRPNRILVAAQAATLLLCAGNVLLTTVDAAIRRSGYASSSAVFLFVVLLSQHRSVWIAGLVGMTAVLIFAAGGRARSRAFVLLAAGAWLAFIGWTTRIGGEEVLSSAMDTGTLDWRTSGWQTLVSDAFAQGPLTVAIGEPFGSGFVRTVASGASTGVSPHNWYIQLFLRLGIIGLMVFAGMLIAAVLKLRARPAEYMFSLITIGVYSFAYAVSWFFAPWLAAAVVASLQTGGVTVGKSKPAPVRR